MTSELSQKLVDFLNICYEHFHFYQYFYRTNKNIKITAIEWEPIETFKRGKNKLAPDKYEIRDKLIHEKLTNEDFPSLSNFLEPAKTHADWHIQLFEPDFILQKRLKRKQKLAS